MGKTGPALAFMHPNPMDQSCWIFQLAQMCTGYRCIAIDVPGCGRSPKARPGLTTTDMVQGDGSKRRGRSEIIRESRLYSSLPGLTRQSMLNRRY
jgi:pimeloyl-ACP methyl ester carboxylesterase